jgi:hypothetical protein
MAFMTQPDKLLEIDWPGTGTWTDITPWWLAPEGTTITRGRSDELGTVTAGRASFTLDNSDGRFTAGRTGSPYYPNVKLNRQIRLLAAWVPGKNYVPNPGFETDASGWTGATRSTTRANTGTASGLIHNGTGGTATMTASILIAGLVVGNTYTCSAKVWQPAAGSAPAKLGIAGISSGANSAGTAAWIAPGAYTFTATARYHTLQVIVTSMPSAGDLWVDDIQVEDGGAATTFDGANPAWVGYRFTGFVQGWPVQWAPVGKWAQAAITAADRFAQFGERISWKSMLVEQTRFAFDDPDTYYPLGDAQGAAAAQNIGSRSDVPAMAPDNIGGGGAGTITFGSGTGPGTDQSTAAVFGSNTGSQTAYVFLSCISAVPLSDANSDFSVSVWFATTTVPPVGGDMVLVAASDGTSWFRMTIFSDQRVWFSYRNPNGTIFDFFHSATTVVDGATHHVAFTETWNGATWDITTYLDGVAVSHGTSSRTPLSPNRLYIGGYPSALNFTFAPYGFTGTISHAVFTTGVPTGSAITDIRATGVNGLAGDLPGARISRLLNWVDPTITRRLDAGQSTLAAQATDGSSPLSAMQAVEQAEGGVYFIAGDGAAVLHSRTHRYQVTGVGHAELDAGQYGGDLQPVLDNQHIVNEMTVTTPSGGTGASRNATSKAAYGLYRNTPSLPLANVADAVGLAQNTVGLYSEPAVRVPAATVDLYTQPSLYSTILPLDISSGLYLKNLPGQAAATNVDLVIEGYTEKITAAGWDITFNLTPASLFQVFQLDVSPYNQLDAGNRLAW